MSGQSQDGLPDQPKPRVEDHRDSDGLDPIGNRGSSTQQRDGDQPDLEDKLRGMILGNAQTLAGRTANLPTEDNLLPHLRGLTSDQQQSSPHSQPQIPGVQGSTTSSETSQTTRRRPNQAQRRQQNAQFSIPIDSRSATSQFQANVGFNQSIPFQQSSWHRGGPNSRQSYRGGAASQHRGRGRGHNTHFNAQSSGTLYAGRGRGGSQDISPQIHSQFDQGARYEQALATAVMNHPSMVSENWREQLDEIQSEPPPPQRPPPEDRKLFNPNASGPRGPRSTGVDPATLARQGEYLESLVHENIALIQIENEEMMEKEKFRAEVETICRETVTVFEQQDNGRADFESSSVELKCFGSMGSGFATKGSDMDLAFLSPDSNPPPDLPSSPLPRLLEKRLLDMGFGARLLTRTRVPIIKLCQKPSEKLLSDLRDERLKWEKGFEAEGDLPEDKPAPEGDGDADQEGVAEVAEKQAKEDVSKRKESSAKTAEEIYEERLEHFKQRPGVSIGDFYNAATRLLRNLGGRDVSISPKHPLNAKEIKILTDVSQAFVHGLLDASLKLRLCFYPTLIFNPNTSANKIRSLASILTQVEGERLAKEWGNRDFIEGDHLVERENEQAIQGWYSLMNDISMEPAVYAKNLTILHGKLSTISSLQLKFLEQGAHEDCSQYHRRVAKIMDDLYTPHPAKTPWHVLGVVVKRAIEGVNNSQVREELSKFYEEQHTYRMSLSLLAMKHRALQLAHNFEKALSKEVFAPDDRPVIEEYIALLRNAETVESLVLRKNASLAALLQKIRVLQDPTMAKRDRYQDRLDFPKDAVGVQCDINFSADLALHNTLLLRCYSLTDPRVKPFILFIKYWAKRRSINTPYRGTLSSYGYVLMALHYLVNVAYPFISPNLQQLGPSDDKSALASETTCLGRDVRFWRNEAEIIDLARQGMINANNTDTVGHLLRGFFEYYAQSGPMSTGFVPHVGNIYGFNWGRDVLSLRTPGGLLTKFEKGWTGAVTTTERNVEAAPITQTRPGYGVPTLAQQEGYEAGPYQKKLITQKYRQREEVKEVRHRYLFAIEDPFELDHNVARTVTHNGIVAIRDEFRRAWRIIKDHQRKENLLEVISERERSEREILTSAGKREGLKEMMDALHGEVEN